MLRSTCLLLASVAFVSAHTWIVYPGMRGNNLITNDTFPYGMQWMYPCGGLGTSTNRTYWPTTGGTISVQPGWFQGHESALIYMNMGFGTDGPDKGPQNMSNPMVGAFEILGPSKYPYPGTFCLPQVPLPVNASVKAGDLATIQVVMLAVHGAALYSCVDIIFADPGDERIAEVNETNCFNSTDIGFGDVYTITTRASGAGNLTSGAEATFRRNGNGAWLSALTWLPVFVGGLWFLL